jgi:hypothetical protein
VVEDKRGQSDRRRVGIVQSIKEPARIPPEDVSSPADPDSILPFHAGF